MPPKFTSRQLAYEAPPVPSFLQKLHSQVNQNRGSINDKRAGNRQEETSEFDSLLGIGSSSGKDTRPEEEEEDEFDGAQVVVLKEGKHLSKEEASKAGKSEKDEVVIEELGQAAIAGPKAAPNSSTAVKRKQTSSTTETQSSDLDDVKKLIQSTKKGTEDQDVNDEAVKLKRKEEKERIKAEKNKRARIEKSKRGKGLSFQMDD